MTSRRRRSKNYWQVLHVLSSLAFALPSVAVGFRPLSACCSPAPGHGTRVAVFWRSHVAANSRSRARGSCTRGLAVDPVLRRVRRERRRGHLGGIRAGCPSGLRPAVAGRRRSPRPPRGNDRRRPSLLRATKSPHHMRDRDLELRGRRAALPPRGRSAGRAREARGGRPTALRAGGPEVASGATVGHMNRVGVLANRVGVLVALVILGGVSSIASSRF